MAGAHHLQQQRYHQQQQQLHRQQQQQQQQRSSEPDGCSSIIRFLTCYLLEEPHSPVAPTLIRPLPDPRFVKWTDNLRQQRLQRSLSDGYGASPTVVARDASFLVNVGCDRQSMDAGSWQPQAYQPGPDTFRRLLSAQSRAQQQQQQQQQLPQQQSQQQQLPLQHYHHHYQQHHQQQYQQQLSPVMSGQVGLSTAPVFGGNHAAAAAYHPQHRQQPQQVLPASVTAAAAAAAAAAARHASATSWTDSRKQLEANLAMEQSISQMQLGPDYLNEQQRLVQRLARLRLEEQLSVADGNCQFRSVSEQLYGTQEYHGFVRQQAVNHIKANPASYATFLGEDFAYYCVGMAQDGTWGDELTLRAICDSFGVAVHVVTSEQRNWYLRYEPLSYKSRLEVFLTYIAPMHYNSLRRQKMFGRHPPHVSHIAGQ